MDSNPQNDKENMNIQVCIENGEIVDQIIGNAKNFYLDIQKKKFWRYYDMAIMEQGGCPKRNLGAKMRTNIEQCASFLYVW